MPQHLEALFAQFLALPENEQRKFSRQLRVHLRKQPTALHPDWAAELDRRSAEIDAGEVEMVPWSVVDQEAKEMLREARKADREERNERG